MDVESQTIVAVKKKIYIGVCRVKLVSGNLSTGKWLNLIQMVFCLRSSYHTITRISPNLHFTH